MRKHEMAIALKANSSYNLVSESSSSEDKIRFHVKLTDSCLRALEDYQTRLSAQKKKLSIQFLGQTGLISIPVRKGSADDGTNKFQFTCSSMPAVNNQGCLDCVQQVRGSDNIATLGTITHKVNVMATDDIYQTTRVRMKEAEEERKEVRTKIIKMPNKSAVKRNKGNKQSSIMAAVKRKMQPVTRVSNGPNKSLRERVIHLLAVRPYKKIELIYRLQKDGVSLKDSNLTNILQQVAVTNDNKYKLLKHLYSEVQVDTWQDYSETDKQQVQRNIQEEGANVQMKISEATTSSPKDTPERKRRNVSDSLQSTKKMRVAPISTNNNNNSTSSPPKSVNPNPISSISVSKDVKHKVKLNNAHSKDNCKAKTLESNKDSSSSDLKKNSSLLNNYSSLLNNSKKDSSLLNDSKSVSNEFGKKSSKKTVSCDRINDSKKPTYNSPAVDNIPDYKKKYKKITSYEQRCSYKRDFQAEFDEYRELRRSVDAQTKKFTELENKYRKFPPESIEAKEIGKQVEKLYIEIAENEEWQSIKRRYQELHPKLDYIKKLISDYDMTNRATGQNDGNT